jgi:hypothetical protein
VPLPEGRACAPQGCCQASLVFLERDFRALAIIDLEADSGYASRQPIMIFCNDATPLQQPDPRGLADQHAILELETIHFAEARCLEPTAELAHVIRVNAPGPALERLRHPTGVEPQTGAPRRIDNKSALGDVPLPSPDLR